jgi:hypothetical protein
MPATLAKGGQSMLIRAGLLIDGVCNLQRVEQHIAVENIRAIAVGRITLMASEAIANPN